MDSGLCVGDFEEDFPVPVASPGSVILQSEVKLDRRRLVRHPCLLDAHVGKNLECYLLRCKVADDAVGVFCSRRHIARDIQSSTHAVLCFHLWVSRDLAGIEDEAARCSLGNRNAEATCHEEFGHDLIGSGRGKDVLDA